MTELGASSAHATPYQTVWIGYMPAQRARLHTLLGMLPLSAASDGAD